MLYIIIQYIYIIRYNQYNGNSILYSINNDDGVIYIYI